MKDKVKRFSLLLLSAAMISSSLPSCSKSGDTGPAAAAAQSEQSGTETTTAETTAAAEEKPEETSAVTKKEKKSKETTTKKKKKKKKSSTSSTAEVTTSATEEEFEEPAEIVYAPSAIELYIDKESGFFSDNAISLLGLDKESILDIITYNEDYMIMSDSDKDGTEKWDYFVDGRDKHSLSLEFADGKLREISCSSQFSDFNTALSFAKTMGWERDESQTVKGKRAYNVTGKNAVYTIYKTRDDDEGQAFITQSYVLGD